MCHTRTPLKNEDTTSVIVLAGEPLWYISSGTNAFILTALSLDLRTWRYIILTSIIGVEVEVQMIGKISTFLNFGVQLTTEGLNTQV